MSVGLTRASFEPLFTARARAGLASPALRFAIVPAAAAWLALLALSDQGRALALCVSPRDSMVHGFLANLAAGFEMVEPARWAADWTLMIVAMMFPLLVPMIGHVAGRSFAPRRGRSVALFVAGYALVWLGAAGVASVALVVARAGVETLNLAPWAGLIGCGLAALWQLSPAKVRAVNRCHGTMPLAAWGMAADRDAAAFGLLHGTRCVRACLPAMALPLLGGYGAVAMLAVFAILLAERARERPQYRLSALALLLLGLITLPA